MKDASDKKEIRRAEKSAKLRATQDNEVVSQIMSHRNGRAWFHRMLGDCGIFQTPISPNPYLTYANNGRQDVGRAILAQITTACPDEYIQMLREANSDGGRTDDNDRRPDDPDAGDGNVVSEYEPTDDRQYEDK